MAKLVSKTYGEALFEFALEEGKLESIAEEVRVILQLFQENEEYVKLLTHPRIDVEEKKTLIEQAFREEVSEDMMGFLETVVQKGRFKEIESIFDYFLAKDREYNKIGVATVTSAVALTEQEKKDIEDKLLATTTYVKFIMEYQVDASLIGGLIIKIGDRVVDSSVKTLLGNMARDLSEIQLSN